MDRYIRVSVSDLSALGEAFEGIVGFEFGIGGGIIWDAVSGIGHWENRN